MKLALVSSLILFAFVFTSCTSQKKIEPDDEFAVEANSGKGAESAASPLEADLSLDDLGAKPVAADKKESAADTSDSSLENELNSLDDNASAKKPAEPVKDELTLDQPPQNVAQQETTAAPQEPVATPAQPQAAVEIPPPQPLSLTEVAPVQEAAPTPIPQETPAAVTPSKIATIANVTYQANSNGGTVAIGADQPLKFTTRLNSTTNQFVLEIENSTIPKKLKRTLNTKDMASSIGSVDIYQKAGSNVSRFVVQLRPGSPEPMVQPEGNTLLIIGGGAAAAVASSADQPTSAAPQDLQGSAIDGKSLAQPAEEIVDLNMAGIMSSDNLEEFLISNNRFYGKKISIETNQMEIKEAIKFIAEESGVNMIIDESVDGKVSLKLKKVPWDQALILLLKSKKLGFKRQGSVLRIGKIEDFKRDELEAVEMKEARRSKAPSIVKRFFIGYADITDLEKKIATYLETIATVQLAAKSTVTSGSLAGSQLPAAAAKLKESIGSVLSDKRTNSLIVTDTEENMVKITKLIEALDTQPQQVLIEGKVVEAKESFTRGLGVNWSSGTIQGPVSTNRGAIGITPILDPGATVLDGSFTWGNLDILGSLTARIALGEREDKVRVLSSPRIAVLSNVKAVISQTVGLLIPISTTSGTGSGTTTVQNQIVPVGVTLDVTPLVSNEGTVTLELDIQRSFLSQVDSKTPDIRSVKTKVIVKSGQTAVIGGIFESETREATSGVPGFKDLPILGKLFQSEREGKSKNELVIFVTPTILKPVVGTEKKTTEIQ